MKNRILKLLRREDGHYSSGQKIADELGITRNAVHKHIKSLKAIGYPIESMKAKGYKLVDDPNFIDYPALKKKLERHILGSKIIHHNSIGSTNDEAYKLAQNGCNEGVVVISDRQTKGRGRMGRSWESSMMTNLYFSVVLRPKMPPPAAPKITLLSALAVSQAIFKTASKLPKIKWPNDILLNGKKVCGILTEMRSEADVIDFIVIGIGINVNSEQNEFPKELCSTVTTIRSETGRPAVRASLLENIILNLEKWYIILKEKGFSKIKSEWSHYSYLTGKRVTVKTIDEELTGSVQGIDDSGFLILKTNGKTRKIFSGTIIRAK